MNKLIPSMLNSPQVLKASADLKASPNQMLELYFDSGLEYLECLNQRIKTKRVFDRQFSVVRQTASFSNLTPEQLFITIRNAAPFWFWWSTKLWSECYKGSFNDQTELFYQLQFSSDLIPNYILKKIIHEQKQNSSQRAYHKSAHQTSAPGAETRPAIRGAWIHLQHGSVPEAPVRAKQH